MYKNIRWTDVKYFSIVGQEDSGYIYRDTIWYTEESG